MHMLLKCLVKINKNENKQRKPDLSGSVGRRWPPRCSAGEAVCAGKGHPREYGGGVQNRSSQNLPLWHID